MPPRICLKFIKNKIVINFKVLKTLGFATIFALSVFSAFGQKTKQIPPAATDVSAIVRGTAAYAEIALKKAEVDAELESLLPDYTEDFPKIKELRFASNLLTQDLASLNAVRPDETAKLTLALGKLMIRRLEAAIDLWKLRQTYADNHPDVRRALRRWEIFDKTVKDILETSK